MKKNSILIMKKRVILLIFIISLSGCLGSPSYPINPENADTEDFEKSVRNVTDYSSYSAFSAITMRGDIISTEGVIELKMDKTNEKYELNYFLFDEEYLQYYSDGTLYNSLTYPNFSSNSTTNINFSEIPYQADMIKDLPIETSNVTVNKNEDGLYEYNVSYRIQTEVPPEFSSLREGNAKILISKEGDFRRLDIKEQLDNGGVFQATVRLNNINSTSIDKPNWVRSVD